MTKCKGRGVGEAKEIHGSGMNKGGSTKKYAHNAMCNNSTEDNKNEAKKAISKAEKRLRMGLLSLKIVKMKTLD